MALCASSVRLRNVCHTGTAVSSLPHIVFLDSMYIVKRIKVFVSVLVSLYIITLWGMLNHSPNFKALKALNKASPSTRHCCISWEFIFCPLMKADTGTKLVSLLSWTHNKGCWVICTFYLEAGEMRRGIFFVSFYAAHCSEHCLYFPIVSTEYGVDMKIL